MNFFYKKINIPYLSKKIGKYGIFFLLLLVFACSDHIENDKLPLSDFELSKETIYNDFKPLWNWYLESTNGGWKNNDNGRFSNDDGPAIKALLELYKLTKDTRYLEKLKSLVTKLLNNDDIKRGLADQHRGNKILPGWSSTRYTKDNSRTIFLMDDALILIPIIEAYNYLKNTENSFFTSKDWLERAEKEFELVFKNDWKSINNNQGYFQDIYYTNDDLNMPMNQYAIVGELCAFLYESTGNSSYKEYAIKTANFLKENLILKSNSYLWYYRKPSQKYPSIIYDDFSHSQLVWRFINTMYKLDLVFNDKDIELMRGTFKHQVMDGNKVFWYFGGMFNENTPATADYLHMENAWLHYFFSLASYDNDIKSILTRYQYTRGIVYDPNSDFNHIGEFVLLHFALGKKYLN